VKNLEGILGVYDDTEWRAAAYDPDPVDGESLYREADEPDFADEHPLAPGKSYWLISRETAQLEVKGLSLDTSGPFDVTIKPGWNMVANPYKRSAGILVSKGGTTFVSASEAEETVGTRFYAFDPHTDSTTGDTVWYTGIPFATGEMAPYEGYWVNNLHSTDIILRFDPASSLTAEMRGDNRSPLLKTVLQFARRSLHRVMDVVSTISYADKQSYSQPPPPPGAGNVGPNAIGNTSVDGGGGGCFVDTVARQDSSASDRRATVLFAALASVLTAVSLVRGRSRMK